MACFYVIYRYVISERRSIRPVENNQYDITMATHYDITMGNDIARDEHCEITMGNDVARDIHCDVTMSNDVDMCTYHGITMHNDVDMNLFNYVFYPLCIIFYTRSILFSMTEDPSFLVWHKILFGMTQDQSFLVWHKISPHLVIQDQPLLLIQDQPLFIWHIITPFWHLKSAPFGMIQDQLVTWYNTRSSPCHLTQDHSLLVSYYILMRIP